MKTLHPFQLYNTSTADGLKNYILAFFKHSDDVRVLSKGQGKVDVLILVKPKWWWFLTFGYMKSKLRTDAATVIEMRAPIGVKITPILFYDRTKFLRAAVEDEV